MELLDAQLVQIEREHTAGAVLLGKTNAPGLNAGAQTVNTVPGATLNPCR